MKKDTKKTVKKSTKKIKPDFVVNLLDVEKPEDVYVKFGMAKQDAGYAMSDVEFDAIVNKVVEYTMQIIAAKMQLASEYVKISGDEKLVFDSKGKMTIKKPNVFKRFWNWVKKPFKK